jgi:4-hydroxyphenylpyruvate dioxygenase
MAQEMISSSPTVLTSQGTSLPLHSKPSTTSDAPEIARRDSQEAHQPVYHGYHHVTWWVGNAKQAASYYTSRFGFHNIAYKGLETGSRLTAHHVVGTGGVFFEFVSPLRATVPISRKDSNGDEIIDKSLDDKARKLLNEMHTHLEQHGDAVKDVAFEVDDVLAVYASAVAKGAVPVAVPYVLHDDQDGDVLQARIRTYGDTTHTLIEKKGYKGAFLPGYKAINEADPLDEILPAIHFTNIDHCVGNQDWEGMEKACDL